MWVRVVLCCNVVMSSRGHTSCQISMDWMITGLDLGLSPTGHTTTIEHNC